MSTTPPTLLDRLRGSPDPAAWRRFDDLYRPLVRHWAAQVPGIGDEADDVAQEVMAVVAREVHAFERRREGAFRAWLRVITANRIRTYRKERNRRPVAGLDAADVFLDRLADPGSDLSDRWNREHDKAVFDRLLTAVGPDFGPAAWEAFRRVAVNGESSAGVAAELGMSPAAVLSAKARVLARLRAEAAGLID